HTQGTTLPDANTYRQCTALCAELVEQTRDGPRIAPAFVRFALEVIDLFENVNGDDEIVVLELEDGVRVVQKDVGIDDVIFLHRWLSGRCPNQLRAEARSPCLTFLGPGSYALFRARRGSVAPHDERALKPESGTVGPAARR